MRTSFSPEAPLEHLGASSGTVLDGLAIRSASEVHQYFERIEDNKWSPIGYSSRLLRGYKLILDQVT